jgi:hypothetical protein
MGELLKETKLECIKIHKSLVFKNLILHSRTVKKHIGIHGGNKIKAHRKS